MNDLMIRQYESINVFFQPDGWFNATIVAARCGKQPRDWLTLINTMDLILAVMARNSAIGGGFSEINGLWQELKVSDLNADAKQVKILELVKRTNLVKIKRGAPENGGGTWLHPKLGVHFAYWLNVGFAVWVGEQIEQLLIQRANPQSDLPTMVPHWLFNFPVVDHATDVRYKQTRNNYILVLGALGFRAPIYKQHITDMVNELLMGHKARPFRRMFGIRAGSRIRTRLYVDGNLRTAMKTVEAIACDRIMREGVTDWIDLQQVVAEVARTVRGDFMSRGVTLNEHVPDVRPRRLSRSA